jgi:hypothetical protein
MHNITNVQIPLKISAPFTNETAAVAPPTHSSMFAHQIREGATPNNKNKNKNKKKSGQRPSSAPSSRSQPTPSTTQQQGVHTSDTFRHTYSGSNGGGGGGSSSGFDQDVNITGEGDSMMMEGTMAYASGSATNVVRTRKQQEQRGGSGNTAQANSNEVGEDDKNIPDAAGDVNNTGELESEELLINRLPAVGLQAYDTLCKVLAHLEPADRVKVVECVLIDSSEINKSQRDQQQHKL